MTWGAPLLAGIVAAIAIPSLLILYFLKLRRREVEISSTLLWKKAIEDLQANAPFQKLRRNILLLLQLLVLAAAIFAIAQPQMMSDPVEGTRHVILIDRSASMRATDGLDSRGEPSEGVTRLDQARREALALVESLAAPSILPWKEQSADEAMVVAFGATGEVLQPFTSDKGRLRAAIEGIEPTDAPSSVTEAMSLVRAQAPSRSFTDDTTGRIVDLPPGPVGTIHLFTDGRITGAEDADLHAEDVLRYYRVGAPDASNIGITSLRAGRGLKDPDHLSIFVGLQSTAGEPREVDVELLINGAAVAVRSASISAAQTQETVTAGGVPAQRFTPGTGGVTFEMQRPEGAFVTVALRPPQGTGPLDHLAVDDVAWLVAPPAKRLGVALVMPPGGNLFLREAVAGLPIESVRILTPDEYRQMASRAETGRFDAVIFDRWLPEAPEGLPPGRFLIFGITPPVGLTDIGEAEPTVIYDWAQDHPVLRGLNLGPVQIFEARRVEAVSGGAARALANGGSGVLMAEVATAQTRAIVVTFDIAASSWAMESSFIVFLGQALRYLAADLDADVGRMVRPGETFADRIPQGAQSVRVTHLPTGNRDSLVPAPDGRVVFGPIVRVGEYELSWLGEAGPTDERDGSRVRRRFTANLLNPDESDTRAAPDVQIATRAVGVTSDEDRARQPRRLWPWLLLAALVIMMIEWWIYNRKVTL